MIAFINLHVSWDDDFLTVISIMIWDWIEHDDLGHVLLCFNKLKQRQIF